MSYQDDPVNEFMEVLKKANEQNFKLRGNTDGVYNFGANQLPQTPSSPNANPNALAKAIGRFPDASELKSVPKLPVKVRRKELPRIGRAIDTTQNLLALTSSEKTLFKETRDGISTVLGPRLITVTPRSPSGATNLGFKSGKLVERAVLYIDIRNSTSITENHQDDVAAKIYSAFHKGLVRVARSANGTIAGFAGDRIMVVFDKTDFKTATDQALRCAVLMLSFIDQHLSPMLATKYNHPIACGIGIDFSRLTVVRSGIGGINNSTTIWAGKAANIASKLADEAIAGTILISERAEKSLGSRTKLRFSAEQWLPGRPAVIARLGNHKIVPKTIRNT